MKGSKRLRGIKAISFDGDMTLWDFERVMRHALGFALQEFRRRLPGQTIVALTIDKMIELRNRVAAELKGRVTNLEQIRLLAFVRTVEYVGESDKNLAADLNAIYLKHRFEDIELYPDVLPTLDALGPRFRLGLVSNGNSYPERCGLAERLAFVVFSQDVGCEKPQKEIFQVACSRAGCRSEELLHVGDSLESDVAGASVVGAVSVWLNRSGQTNSTDIKPDIEIGSLESLIGILNGMP